jgi:hypothetical protein
MYTLKTLDNGWLVFTASLFLWISMPVAYPQEFRLKTPVPPLTVPIDFNQRVYVETTTTAQVFYSGPHKDSPEAYSVVNVDLHDNKMSLVIQCDWLHRTAKVTATFTDSNHPQMILEKDVDEYKIISGDPNKVCLLLTPSPPPPLSAVKVIMMHADIGSFVESISMAGTGLNGTQIYYGFCRN